MFNDGNISGVQYLQVRAGTVGVGSLENAMYVLPAGRLTELRVQTITDSPVGASTIISVLVFDDLDDTTGTTALSCTLADAGTVAACSASGSFAVTSGQTMAVEWNESNNENNGRTTVTVSFAAD
jgi:hypothetical protein